MFKQFYIILSAMTLTMLLALAGCSETTYDQPVAASSGETVASSSTSNFRALRLNLESLLDSNPRHRKIVRVNQAIPFLISHAEGWRVSGMTEQEYVNVGLKGKSFQNRTGGPIDRWQDKKGEWVCHGHFGYWVRQDGAPDYREIRIALCASKTPSNYAIGDKPADCLENLRAGIK